MNSIQNYGMANFQRSANNNVSFGARFRAEDIEKLIADAMNEQKCGRFPKLPQLHTLLERLDEFSKSLLAELKVEEFRNNWGERHFTPKMLIDGKEVYEHHSELGTYWLDSLKNFITGGGANFLKMPESIFEQEVWKNRNVTADDIRKFVYKA